jgi:tRNA (cmo5U34)-methyltransferase
MEQSRDDIYARPQQPVEDFVFDEKVADVFHDMITRSVPGYGAIITMIGLLAEEYVQAGTCCYDLGCSLGAATRAMRSRLEGRHCQIVAIDNSEAMLKHARSGIAADSAGQVPVRIECADIREAKIENASFVVLNFVLQFIDPLERLQLLAKIYHGLVPGGMVVLSEKSSSANAAEDEFLTHLYYSFKRFNGYRDLEISQKRTALENVLITDSMSTHMQRFQECGYQKYYNWFRCFNFTSFVAIK